MVVYSDLSRNFADVKDLTVAEVGDKIGGKVKQNIDSGVFKNACAIRMSYAFNYSGETISSNDGAVSSGDDGKWYLYRVADMEGFVKRVTGLSSGIIGSKAADFSGKKGVVFFDGCGWGDATGHVDLFDGSRVEGEDYFERCSRAILYEIS